MLMDVIMISLFFWLVGSTNVVSGFGCLCPSCLVSLLDWFGLCLIEGWGGGLRFLAEVMAGVLVVFDWFWLVPWVMSVCWLPLVIGSMLVFFGVSCLMTGCFMYCWSLVCMVCVCTVAGFLCVVSFAVFLWWILLDFLVSVSFLLANYLGVCRLMDCIW